MKLSVTIDGIRLKSVLKNNQSLISTNKSFFYTTIGLTQSHEGVSDDIDGFYQILPGSYKIDRPKSIIGIDRVHLKGDCIDGSILNGVGQPILFSFALSSPPGHKIYKTPRILLFKKVNKSVLSHKNLFIYKTMITNLLILMEKR